jgi:MFS family permease
MQTVQTGKSNWRNVLRGNVLGMGLVSLFTDFSSEMINPLLPVFIAGLAGGGSGGLGRAALYVGLMEGVAETIAALLKLVSGRLSDRLGRRKLLVLAGYGFSSVARPAMALAGGVGHVLALKALDRVGKGVRTAPRDALIGDSVSADVRGLAFSFHRAMDHTGAVLGPLVAFALLAGMGGGLLWQGAAAATGPTEMEALRRLFALAVVPGALALLALLLLVRDVAPRAAGAPAAGSAKPVAAVEPLPRPLYGTVAAVTLFALGNSSDLFIVLLARERFDASLAHLIGLWVLLHLAKIAFSIPGGILSDRLGRRRVILWGWAVYAVVYLGFAFAAGPAVFWALLVAYGFYYGMTEGVEKALIADLAPAGRRATAFGLYHGAVGLAMLPASAIFGLVWKTLGAGAAFGVGAIFAALAAVVLMLVLPRGR